MHVIVRQMTFQFYTFFMHWILYNASSNIAIVTWALKDGLKEKELLYSRYSICGQNWLLGRIIQWPISTMGAWTHFHHQSSNPDSSLSLYFTLYPRTKYQVIIKLFLQTSLKIFKHYKLKPSFSIIKDEKDKVGVGDKPPTTQVSTVWSSLSQFNPIWSSLCQIDPI